MSRGDEGRKEKKEEGEERKGRREQCGAGVWDGVRRYRGGGGRGKGDDEMKKKIR